jgi:pimeloyl-ACP methyl ester carboxylesterase
MSMGGYVALAFAERHKNSLAGLGLISTQATADTSETQQSRRVMIEKIRHQGTAPALEAILPKLFSDENQDDAELKLFPSEGAKNAGVEGLCWALEAMARRGDRTELLRTLSVPAAVIHGTSDKLIPAARARQMSESIPDSKYFEFPAGHATPLEAPKDVATALLDLLERSSRFHPTTSRKRSSDEPGIVIAPSERGL